ncbi:MAG: ABC transporter permease [Bacteroidota bacterium]
MLRNYLLTALRSFAKKKSYTFINILGLAIGLASSFLIFLWVQSEYQIDRFHANGQRLYQVMKNEYFSDGQIRTSPAVPMPLAETLEENFPEFEEAELALWDRNMLVSSGEDRYREKGAYFGQDFFTIFSYPFIAGNPNTALQDINAIVISETLARKYFGEQNALGKSLQINDEEVEVTGVFKDVPKYSSIAFDFAIPMEKFIRDNKWTEYWDNNGLRMFTLLESETDVDQINANIKNIIKEHAPDEASELFLKPYTNRYLYGEYQDGQQVGGRITYVRIFSVVAIFMLIIACINFMNLATARSAQRAKEVGVRKAIGANQQSLIGQFMIESTIVVLFALALAILLVELTLPLFNQFTSKNISVDYHDPILVGGALSIVVFTSLLAGSYPALFLSSFHPSRVLKGAVPRGNKATLFRRSLVVFQFTLSILLIIGTLIVYLQIDYILNKDLGLERENLVYMYKEGMLSEQYDVFKQQLLQQPGILDVTTSNQNPLEVGHSSNGALWDGKAPNDNQEFLIISAGYDFIKTMGMQLREGRDFSSLYSTDTANYIINEAAARAMSMDTPVGEPLTLWGIDGEIIGLAKNFHNASLHESISPLIIRLAPENTYYLFVKTESGQTVEALASMEKVAGAINPAYPFEYEFLDQTFQEAYQREETIGKLSTIFATLAILISCLGLLGLASFTAEQRTKEIGARKVLGASVSHLVWLLSSDFTRLVAISFVIASPIAYYLMKQWLQDFEYQVDLSVGIFVLAGLAALLIAWLTVGYQSVRTARANPVDSLRSE